MKTRLLLIFFTLFGFAEAEAQQAKSDSAFVSKEIPASYPGGTAKFYAYLSRNIKYPTEAKNNNIQGKVVVQFTVETNGNIVNTKILQGLSADTNAEAARLILGSANWIPAQQNGIYVRSIMTIPIVFSLSMKDPKEKP